MKWAEGMQERYLPKLWPPIFLHYLWIDIVKHLPVLTCRDNLLSSFSKEVHTFLFEAKISFDRCLGIDGEERSLWFAHVMRAYVIVIHNAPVTF